MPGKERPDVSQLFLLVQNIQLNIIPHQRLFAVLAEDSLCLALVSGSPTVYIIESCDSFDYLSAHSLRYSAVNDIVLVMVLDSGTPGTVLPSSSTVGSPVTV